MAKKIKYQGGLTKIICQKKANWQKNKFKKYILELILIPANPRILNFEIISFSGSSAFEDQLLSIYSFVYYAGVPISWVIYSDKTYTEKQKETFLRKFPFVKFLDWNLYDLYLKRKVLNNYLKVNMMAKKLNIIAGHVNNNTNSKYPIIYIDSDIVFYKNISYYFNSEIINDTLWYVPDVMWGNVENYFSIKRKHFYPVNAGFLILKSDFNINDLFDYLESLDGNFGYFSEQSSFEYALRLQNGQPLDPRQFIIDTGDQFDFSTKYQPYEIAMRHYTGPVRHKMWQNGFKWHFKAQ